ncbi:MAG: fumarylacetoacetase [Gemmataceae bacterium]|nr:fumarylacetoacetase [Gemmataceae bacterium]
MTSTTDPALRSFLPIAPESHFPIQNLPYGVFSEDGSPERIGVAIGEYVLDLGVLDDFGLLDELGSDVRRALRQDRLNAFAALGRQVRMLTRFLLSRLLSADEPTLRDNKALRDRALVPMSQVQMVLPFHIGDYTDFYSSREHASNVGTMLRGADNALQRNWLHLPVAYHGRASSVVVSGTDLRRPLGQAKADDAPAPTLGPSRSLDFELELGYFVGVGNELGRPVPIDEAPGHLFGMVLVNDWSARDIQKWEYVPLGPFLAKNFGTSISPWVVTMEALRPFRVPGPVQDPPPLEYLRTSGDWAFDIQLEVWLQGEQMTAPQRLCASHAKYLYWNVCQQLAHHTAGGCNLRPGDLLATGTISGPTPDSYGSLLELSWKGTRPLHFPDGSSRVFLQDGDRVTLTGWCQGQGYRVGFGEATGRILPAPG